MSDVSVTTPRLVVALGAAGLIPMMSCALLIKMAIVQQILTAYSLAIIAFLAGTWWATALINGSSEASQKQLVLVLSNLVVLAAVGGVIWLPAAGCFLLYAALFVFLAFGEGRLSPFRPQPVYYARMRRWVSGFAALFHLVAANQLAT